MQKKQISDFQKTLKLIAHENKFQIIKLLANGEVCVCDIGEKLGLEQSLVSHHLRSLKKAKLVKTRKISTWVHCSLDIEEFEKISQQFVAYFSPKNISTAMCSIHEECRCLVDNNLPTKKGKNEK